MNIRSILQERFRELHLAFVFFTRIPLPNLGKKPAELRSTLWAWPIVGLLIGFLSGLVFVVVSSFFSISIAAVITILTTIFLTGAFHEDGLADCADSFGAFEPQRRLEIMKDSSIGTYGVLALIAAFSLRVFALIEIGRQIGGIEIIVVLMMAYSASRVAMIGVLIGFKPVVGHGLREQVRNISRRQFSASYLIALLIFTSLALYLGFAILTGAMFIIVSLVMPILLAVIMQKRIGGFNGDVLGGVCILSEVIGLMLLSSIIINL